MTIDTAVTVTKSLISFSLPSVIALMDLKGEVKPAQIVRRLSTLTDQSPNSVPKI